MGQSNQIAGYEIVGALGHGARSHIYEVRDENGDHYALKHVVREQANDERAMEQAICEHEIAKQFNHPNLRRSLKLIRRRRLLRIGEIIVIMELFRGQTIENARIDSILDRCGIFRQVCAGLFAMHRAGYVHADIKPNNILVDADGAVKIIDFGQSCEAGEVKARIQGTPDYIAPEQVRREPITHRTDIFNLGATMYWMLTDRHILTLLPKREHGGLGRREAGDHRDRKAPMEINPAVPRSLSGLVMECVRDDPRDRPDSMNYVYKRLGLTMKQMVKQAAAAG